MPPRCDHTRAKEMMTERNKPTKLILSRRNLETLLSKLDRVRDGRMSACTIIKYTPLPVEVIAVEDEVAYRDREPGDVIPEDTPTRCSECSATAPSRHRRCRVLSCPMR